MNGPCREGVEGDEVVAVREIHDHRSLKIFSRQRIEEVEGVVAVRVDEDDRSIAS